MNRFKFVLMFFLILFISTAVLAQIPRTLSYQGILTDQNGKPRVDKTYQFTFCLYDTATGGSALWTEQKTLSVTAGLFSTILGDQKPFGAAVKFDKQYWLGIQVGNEAELSPRIRLTSVGYSLNAVRADTARVSNSISNGIINGNLTINGADLKLGTSDGHSVGNIPWQRALVHENNEQLVINYGGDFEGGTRIDGISLEIQGSNLKLGTSDGHSVGNIPWQRALVHENNEQLVINYEGDFEGGTRVDGRLEIAGSDLCLGTRDGRSIGNKPLQRALIHDGNGDVLVINCENDFEGGTRVEGRLKTNVLEITGADFAEPFEMSHTDSLPLGSLVVIDPEHPGQLKQATESYDKRVAGVISGAGGIYPGIMVTKDVNLNNSQYVAMTGKVYALATASNGAIEPGDLLTTSGVPGHAMKATDKELWDGTIIGKAMSSLKEGDGLVLVLVNLQ